MPTDRDRLLDVAAVLFAILAISNFAKPLATNPETGFIFFGRRLAGTPNAIIGPLFGLYLLTYAVGIWRRRRWALPMGIVYAGYVIVNLLLFTLRDPTPAAHGIAFNVVYGIVAIGISIGTVIRLRRAALT
jgi:hypothetical protein